jgi:hypothetical protein
MSLRDLIVIDWTCNLFESIIESIRGNTDETETGGRILRGILYIIVIAVILLFIKWYIEWILLDWETAVIPPAIYITLIFVVQFLNWIGGK